MPGLARQYAVILVLVCAAAVWVFASAARSKDRLIETGFWFEAIGFDHSQPMTDKLGGPLADAEIGAVASVARAEIVSAFTSLRIVVTENRNAEYQVRVVQQLFHPMSRRYPGPSGESRSSPGLGGRGAVNFVILANQAVAYAPPGTGRSSMIEAIGRGIGRAAVHEFAHQLLGSLAIHDSTDIRSYEYRSADRAGQFYGEMHWDIAWPALLNRFGSANN